MSDTQRPQVYSSTTSPGVAPSSEYYSGETLLPLPTPKFSVDGTKMILYCFGALLVMPEVQSGARDETKASSIQNMLCKNSGCTLSLWPKYDTLEIYLLYIVVHCGYIFIMGRY